MKDIVVLYHASCPDGFGSAYAAWKKFGDTATYIAMEHGELPQGGVAGKEVYVLDYSFKKEVMLSLEQSAKRLVVIDHHIGAKEAVESVREHVFDNDHSGAGLTWRYFHPRLPVPRLIEYIEDNDINRDSLPHIREITTLISVQPHDFDHFDKLAAQMGSEEGLKIAVEHGATQYEYMSAVCDTLAAKAEEVEFEGHHIFAVNIKAPQLFRDEVGYRLSVQKERPFALMWNEDSKGRGFSMRGDGSVDLSKLAQKYGGNGHVGAASFRLRAGSPLPFAYVQKKSLT